MATEEEGEEPKQVERVIIELRLWPDQNRQINHLPAGRGFGEGQAEAFIGTFKRDYVHGAELRDAETVLAQLGGWIGDYNTQAPRSALGMPKSVSVVVPRGMLRTWLIFSRRRVISATAAGTVQPNAPPYWPKVQ